MRRPKYSLPEFQELFAQQHRVVTQQARRDALQLGFGSDDVEQVIAELAPSDFYKTMPAERVPGLWQDVYKPEARGIVLYVKIQIAGPVRTAVLISFKEA